jgi:hypothetical protein
MKSLRLAERVMKIKEIVKMKRNKKPSVVLGVAALNKKLSRVAK